MISGKLDLTPLLRRMRATPEILHEQIQKMVLAESRLLVSSSGKIPGLVQVTPPFSNGVKGIAAKKQGEVRVEDDIRKAYGSPSDLWRLIRDAAGRGPADNFWAYMKLKRWEQANQIAMKFTGYQLESFDGGAEHRARRDARTGHVRGGKQPRDKRVFLSPAAARSFEAYIKRKKNQVGLLASSLPSAASALGKITGVPAWVSRHHGPWGRCGITRTRNSLHVTLGLTQRAIADLQRRFGYVLDYRVKAFQRQIPYIKRHALKQARMQVS